MINNGFNAKVSEKKYIHVRVKFARLLLLSLLGHFLANATFMAWVMVILKPWSEERASLACSDTRVWDQTR